MSADGRTSTPTHNGSMSLARGIFHRPSRGNVSGRRSLVFWWAWRRTISSRGDGLKIGLVQPARGLFDHFFFVELAVDERCLDDDAAFERPFVAFVFVVAVPDGKSFFPGHAEGLVGFGEGHS